MECPYKMNRILLILILLSNLTFGQAPAWTSSVAAGTLTEAGSNYSLTQTSATNQTTISVSGMSTFTTYYVTIHKIDSDWNSGLALWARRSNNGTASSGSISGGTSFIQLSSSPQSFFTMSSGWTTSRTNIQFQYQITGISVLIPAKTHTTTIVYTLSN